MRNFLVGLLAMLGAASASTALAEGDVIELAANHPDRHVVVKGDTLWDISETFLQSPWEWPKVWSYNPQIDNPHLIYPGDIIYLVYVNGKPQLRLERGGPRKLSPQVRRNPLGQVIQAIPLDEIKSFLSDNLILSRDELEAAPYVLAGVNSRIIAGAGDRVYARGDIDTTKHTYMGIYRPSRTYVDPESGEILGYESSSIGGGYITHSKGDITTLKLKYTNEEVRIKDRVLPTQEQVVQSVFYPSAPDDQIDGVILSVLRGVSRIGQYDVVAINRGSREGLKTGNVLHVYKKGETVKDPVTNELIDLPSERGGTLMVFKVFDKVSYALVMRAVNALSLLDEVRSPD